MNLFEILDSVYPLTLELKTFLGSVVKHSVHQKGDILLKPGRVCDQLYFIQKGILRAFSIIEGEEKTAWIKSEGEFVTSICSFYKQIKGREFLEALDYTEVFSITYSEFFNAINKHLPFSNIGFHCLYPVLVEWDDLRNTFQTMDAAQRFEWFMSSRGHLLEKVPGNIIASYLNMEQA